MEEIRIKIPPEMKFIGRVPDIDWSVLFNKFVKAKIEEINRLKKGLLASKLTKKDVEYFSDEINKSLAEKYLE
ncbi:MAG: hypothetical protein KJ905_02420 [Nanoarchaeota archaeon]|nr:hypothetical protein [Nanoarchaeota archaeon]MBU1501606.1 hypothetical protein [Nanoarchaeota archaeon]MBU2459302.1 hypothetical protein [Nanoarchaeota archaeon]